jgi:hypothetical protein
MLGVGLATSNHDGRALVVDVGVDRCEFTARGGGAEFTCATDERILLFTTDAVDGLGNQRARQ